jgi:hypothetical protein
MYFPPTRAKYMSRHAWSGISQRSGISLDTGLCKSMCEQYGGGLGYTLHHCFILFCELFILQLCLTYTFFFIYTISAGYFSCSFFLRLFFPMVIFLEV